MGNLSSLEKQRISEIIATALGGDWERFAFLTDRPFSNAASMKEQFEDSSRLIKALETVPRPDPDVKTQEDGSRLILAKIALDDPTEHPIQLIIHSTSERDDTVVSIWAFFQEVTFD